MRRWHGWHKIGVGTGLEKYWKSNNVVIIFNNVKKWCYDLKCSTMFYFLIFCYICTIFVDWMMMMMNFFCRMIDIQKAFSLFSVQDHCQRFVPLLPLHRTRIEWKLFIKYVRFCIRPFSWHEQMSEIWIPQQTCMRWYSLTFTYY